MLIDRTRIRHFRLTLCCLYLFSSAIFAAGPTLTDLGGGKLQLGQILIHKDERWFSLPGRVLRDEPPLEYLAVKKGGMKGYESLFELDTTAGEFNIACILIGLDADNAVLPRYHFDKRSVKGDGVDVLVEWGEGDGVTQTRAEKLFLLDGKSVQSREWAYTGSVVLPDKRYLAEEAGTLIGFIHDRDSIIEHRKGIGLGQFGEVKIDRDLLPPVGTPIRVTIRSVVSK